MSGNYGERSLYFKNGQSQPLTLGISPEIDLKFGNLGSNLQIHSNTLRKIIINGFGSSTTAVREEHESCCGLHKS